eukprot:tig00001471_g8878.t1
MYASGSAGGLGFPDDFDEEPANLDEEEYEETREEREFAYVLPEERNPLLDEHERTCQHRLEDLEGKLGRLEASAKTGVWVNHARIARLRSHCQALRAQRNTWRLMKLLAENNVLGDGLPPPDSMVEDGAGPTGAYSEAALWTELHERDPEYRLFETVRVWLEACAVESVSFVEGDAQPLRTLQRLQRSESLETCVGELDPDAPRRLGKPLDPDDQDAQARLFHAVFQLIRAGHIEPAKELCSEAAGAPWLAALLHGLQLSHDPAHSDLLAGDGENASAGYEAGNVRPGLFGELCGRLAAAAGAPCTSAPSTASWGPPSTTSCPPAPPGRTTSGPAPPSPPAPPSATSWRRGRIRTGTGRRRGRGRGGGADAGEVLEAARGAGREDGAGVYREVQEALIAGRGPEVEAQRLARGYVLQLAGRLQSGLVARYAGLAVVGHRERVDLLGRYLHSLLVLPDEADAGDAARTRRRALDAARKAVAAFPEEAVEILDEAAFRTAALPSPGPSPGGGVNATDARKIRAVEVVELAGGAGPGAPRSLAARALVHANALARRFVEEGKLDALGALSDAVRVAPHQEELEAMQAAYREHLCWRDFVAAHRAYEAWRAWEGRRPAPPAPVPVTTTEVARGSTRRRTRRTRRRCGGTARTARPSPSPPPTASAPSSSSPAAGSAAPGPPPLPSDAEEEAALRRLRCDCVPRAVGWMRDLLAGTDRHADCVRLAEMVADDEYGLHESFSPEAMRAFLRDLAPALVHLAPALADF